jgi:hypothetical protein
LHVADAGEAAYEHVSTDLGGDEIDVADIRRQQIEERNPGEHRVRVGVDQARHQRPAAAVDDERAPRGCNRPAGDLLDHVAVHEHVRGGRQGWVHAVEDADLAKQDGVVAATVRNRRGRPRRLISSGRRGTLVRPHRISHVAAVDNPGRDAPRPAQARAGRERCGHPACDSAKERRFAKAPAGVAMGTEVSRVHGLSLHGRAGPQVIASLWQMLFVLSRRAHSTVVIRSSAERDHNDHGEAGQE